MEKKPGEGLAIRKVETNGLVVEVFEELCQSHYYSGAESDIGLTAEELDFNRRLESAFERVTERPFFRRPAVPLNVLGGPGHGKTTSFKEGAKLFAKEMGMRFVINPSQDYTPTKNDYLFQSFEMSGETSNMKQSGLPFVDKINIDGEEKRFTTSAPPRNVQLVKLAGAATILFDDYRNAASTIQNNLLSIMEEKRFQAVDFGERTYVGGTGNLGLEDGTQVSATSTAFTSRTQTVIAYDTPQNWSERNSVTHTDKFGCGGLDSFFEQHPEFFDMPNKSKKGEPFGCPRTWSKLLPFARECMFLYDHATENGKCGPQVFDMDRLIDKAHSIVGEASLSTLKLHYTQLTNHVIPIVKATLNGQSLTNGQNELMTKMRNTVDATATSFYVMYAQTLASELAARIAENYKQNPDDWLVSSKSTIERYAAALMSNDFIPSRLKDVSLSLSNLNKRLAITVNDKAVCSYSGNSMTAMPSQELALAIHGAIAACPLSQNAVAGVKILDTAAQVISNRIKYRSVDTQLEALDNVIPAMARA